ncbi:MAG: 4-hydroxy-3-methylbut-2-enyl diphosphate reductase [Candidatus Omnitrophica bacterium]|nr:4-hydroxy-3-methylbut-2-enyl diphosphate reductase [Candidatus Omnitrophota bacterium]MDD5429648.1 4-hydroxy-3-methylbut-2-enyl diphosphate reductase [Candidatus Omnitrophota bacterium]
MKKIKVTLAKSAGFCFGVKRALKIAQETSKNRKTIEMLGDIVHNETVVKQVQKTGIKKVSHLSRGKNKTLLVRAHGTSQKLINTAKRLGYSIVDATCPMVKEIHRIAKSQQSKGYSIIIIGDKKHDEVLGIIGQLKEKAMVIDSSKNIPGTKIKKIKKAAIIVQSTQDIEKILPVVAKIKKNIKTVKFFNTICRPTRIKQDEIRKLPLKNDIMLVIGSKTSANTKRLYQISKSLNKNTFWITSKEEINPEWFKKAKSVGITAGASTPDYTTKEVIEKIKALEANTR